METDLETEQEKPPPPGGSRLAGRSWAHLQSSCLLALPSSSLLNLLHAASFLQTPKQIILEECLEPERREENAISSSSWAIDEVSKASSISLHPSPPSLNLEVSMVSGLLSGRGTGLTLVGSDTEQQKLLGSLG